MRLQAEAPVERGRGPPLGLIVFADADMALSASPMPIGAYRPPQDRRRIIPANPQNRLLFVEFYLKNVLLKKN